MSHDQFFPFVGRNDALSVYHSLLSYRQQRNAVYYHASGGLGKTWVLKRLIEECGRQPRWYIAPPKFKTPIIDFFETANRTVGGLRHSIIDRLGREFFGEFKKFEDELRSLKAKDPTNPSVYAQSRRVDAQFFLDFERAVQGKYVGLYFDTFEVVHTLRVGQWLLDFLNDQRTKRCLIAVAGRTPSSILSLPANVIWHELQPFTESETQEYCQEHGWKNVTPVEVTQLCESTNGHPLLMDLMFYFRNANICSSQEFLEPAKGEKDREAKKKKTEQAVVRMFTTPSHSVHLVIQDMAVLERRFVPGIFDLRLKTDPKSYLDLTEYESLRQRFLQNESFKELRSIVKYRPDGNVLTLHDEVLRMFKDHAWINPISPEAPRRQWERLRRELREEIIEIWYPQQIETELKDQSDNEKQTLRRILIAEYLGYLLGFDPQGAGLECYNKYFAEAKSNSDFELGEVLLAEMLPCAERLPNRGFEIFSDHAKWMRDTGQFTAVIPLYKFIAKNYSEPPEYRLFALTHLGHTFRRAGIYTKDATQHASLLAALAEQSEEEQIQSRIQLLDNAKATYELGLEYATAPRVSNRTYQNSFSRDLGDIEESVGNWERAKELFEVSASEGLPDQDMLVAWAQANVSLALLEGRMGEYNVSRDRCQLSIEALTSYPKVRDTDLARAYFALAQIERYDQHPGTARRYYDKALSLVEQVDFRAKFLQGNGVNFYALGRRAHKDQDIAAMAAFQELAFHDLKESIGLCEKSDLKLYLADGLRRMGNVFVELDGLAKIETADGSAKQKIQNLIAESAEFIFSADDSWEFIGSAGRKFSELNLLEKAQRLCEASYLEADALDQFHESFEGITHAASVALRLRRREDVNRYVDYLESLHGYAYQQDLHIANMEIILGHLAFDEQRVNDAADKYVENFRVLADLGGYARRVLELQAQELEQRLKNNSLSQAQRKDILQRLDQAWTKTPVAKSYPRLIFATRSLLQQLR